MSYGFGTQCGHKHRFLFFFTRRCREKLIVGGSSVRGYWHFFEKTGWQDRGGVAYCPKHKNSQEEIKS